MQAGLTVKTPVIYFTYPNHIPRAFATIEISSSIDAPATVQHADQPAGTVRSPGRQNRAHVHLRPNDLQLRAYRQLPDLYLPGHPAALLAVLRLWPPSCD